MILPFTEIWPILEARTWTFNCISMRTVPEEYQKCMTGMKRTLKQTLEIAESAAHPKTKLQAHAIAIDIYKNIMDLTANGVTVNTVPFL